MGNARTTIDNEDTPHDESNITVEEIGVRVAAIYYCE